VLASGALTEVGGALVLKELISSALVAPEQGDLTGFEASTNKIHVADYVADQGDALMVQSVLYARKLVSRLRRQGECARVLLSKDTEQEDVTVRFYRRRLALPWEADDLDEYKDEEVIAWDV